MNHDMIDETRWSSGKLKYANIPRPRAATSVATKMGARPVRNSGRNKNTILLITKQLIKIA